MRCERQPSIWHRGSRFPDDPPPPPPPPELMVVPSSSSSGTFRCTVRFFLPLNRHSHPESAVLAGAPERGDRVAAMPSLASSILSADSGSSTTACWARSWGPALRHREAGGASGRLHGIRGPGWAYPSSSAWGRAGRAAPRAASTSTSASGANAAFPEDVREAITEECDAHYHRWPPQPDPNADPKPTPPQP